MSEKKKVTRWAVVRKDTPAFLLGGLMDSKKAALDQHKRCKGPRWRDDKPTPYRVIQVIYWE